MTKISGERIRALRDDLKMNQGQFAKALKVGQSAVSAWEDGKTPSKETYVLIGNLAPYPENLWFWGQGGLDSEAMLSAASQRQRERGALPASGRVVEIPFKRRTAYGVENAGSTLSLPSEIIRDLGSTYCLLVGRESTGSLLAPGDVVVVDTSEMELPSLNRQVVLVDFDPPETRSALALDEHHRHMAVWPGGLFMGRLVVRFEDEQYRNFAWAAEVSASIRLLVGLWQYKVPSEAFNEAGDFRNPQDRARFATEAKSSGLANLALLPGCRLMGRVIAWLHPPTEKPKR